MRLKNTQYSGTQIRSKCVLFEYAHLGEEGGRVCFYQGVDNQLDAMTKAAHSPMKELTSAPSISAMGVNLYWMVGRLPTASVH